MLYSALMFSHWHQTSGGLLSERCLWPLPVWCCLHPDGQHQPNAHGIPQVAALLCRALNAATAWSRPGSFAQSLKRCRNTLLSSPTICSWPMQVDIRAERTDGHFVIGHAKAARFNLKQIGNSSGYNLHMTWTAQIDMTTGQFHVTIAMSSGMHESFLKFAMLHK